MLLSKKKNRAKMTDDISNQKYFLRYTIVFIIMSLLVYMEFIYNGKSFVFCDLNKGGDGLVQHYNAFVYYGRYLRQIIKTLLFEHRLEIPMWDMSIGYGQDIITTLSYYVIGDPFSALSVFVPTKYSELAYSLLIILRLYCAGAAFSAYCRYRGYKNSLPIIGSMIYVFCYYGLYASILHPYFTLPMIYLPLLFVGVEIMLLEKKVVFYTGIIGLAAVSNFYFFYMLCIMVILYTVFRYVEILGKIRVKELFYWIIRFVIFSFLGILMASVMFVPSVISILTASRVGVENYVPFLYDISYYMNLIPTFMNGGFGGYYTFTGYTAIGLVAVVLLFLKRKEKKEYLFLVVAFFVLLLFLMVPFVGHLFNGGGYVTNRWVWTLSMLVSYIVVVMIPEFRNITETEWKRIAIVAMAVIVVVLGTDYLRSEINVLALFELIIVIGFMFFFGNYKSSISLEIVCACMTAIMIIGNAYYEYSPLEGKNYISKFCDYGTAYESLLKDSPEYILKELKDDSIFRFDTAAISTGDIKRNSAMLLDMNGVAYYFSSTNDTITKFNTDMYMKYSMDQSYDNLDRRSILQKLFGVKYIIVPKGNEQYLPYGYDIEVMQNERYVVYTSENTLPIGFAYDTYLTALEYEKLNVIERQEMLSKAVILDEKIDGLKNAEIELIGKEIEHNITTGEGVDVKKGKIVVSKADATLTISFQDIKDSELYLVWDNLEFKSKNPYELVSDVDVKKMTKAESIVFEKNKRRWREITGTTIQMKSANVSSTLSYKTWKDNYYCGHTDFVGNLGYSEDSRNSITLKFAHPGEYSYDKLRVFVQPMDQIAQNMKHLGNNSMEDVSIGTNRISGKIINDSKKVLCVQVPYSKGWKVFVNGEEQKLLRVDEAFIGVVVPEGEHEVMFKYTTPYFMVGIVLSVIGGILYSALWILSRIKYKKYYRSL